MICISPMLTKGPLLALRATFPRGEGTGVPFREIGVT